MYKLILVLVCFCISICTMAQSTVPTANEVLKPAYAKAAAGGKAVLLIYHASWCGWCRKMDASLQDAAVKPLIDANYVTAHLTVHESKEKKALENEGALELLTQHGGADMGLPYWVVLDKDGKLLADAQYKPGENTGCPAADEEVAHFINVLQKTSRLNAEQLAVVAERFKKNSAN